MMRHNVVKTIGQGNVSTIFTCVTCGVGFRDVEIQRSHYKSEWHRYNLKRRVVGLPMVTEEDFRNRLTHQAKIYEEKSGNNSRYCTICKKAFGNEKAYSNHINSRKHTMQVTKHSGSTSNEDTMSNQINDASSVMEDKNNPEASKMLMGSPGMIIRAENMKGKANKPEVTHLNSDDEDDDWEEIEGDPIPVTDCLFCGISSQDLVENLQHMSLKHSFFIPDFEYCVDIEGLLCYLGSKVGEGMMCLWCNERSRNFFSVLAVQQHMRDKGHCKMLHEGDSVFEYTDYYDYSSSYPDGEECNPDEAYVPEVLNFNDKMQLVLPSGAVLGHRALKLYYKQRLRRNRRTNIKPSNSSKNTQVWKNYKALGYSETTIGVARQRFRDQKYFKNMKDKYQFKLGMKSNKTAQKHFRGQNTF